jgi:cell division protein FtsN
MSDQSPANNNQQMIVIALVVVAVLLAAIVGVIVWQQSQAAKIPAPTASASAPAAGAASAPGTSGAPAGMGQGTTAPGPFDAKTATKVPSSMTPEQVVKAYNEDVIAGKYADAYALLPLDKQQSYGDPAAYEAQVKAYGITSYNMGTPVTSGDTVEIAAEQVTPQMPITYTWTFKKVGNQWFVASRTMGGTVTK